MNGWTEIYDVRSQSVHILFRDFSPVWQHTYLGLSLLTQYALYFMQSFTNSLLRYFLARKVLKKLYSIYPRYRKVLNGSFIHLPGLMLPLD